MLEKERSNKSLHYDVVNEYLKDSTCAQFIDIALD